MTRTEHWRQRLVELFEVSQLSQAGFARLIELDASYFSRLLYPSGKPGRKNLGLDTMLKIREAFKLAADWFDLPLGSAMPTEDGDEKPVAREREAHAGIVPQPPLAWPFSNVSLGRLNDLKQGLGRVAGHEAIRDIDAHLDVVVTKWERALAERKKRPRMVKR